MAIGYPIPPRYKEGKCKVSMLLCPMCGKMTSRRFFDPESLALDILVQDVQGLGKGRGFKSKGRRSILGRSDIVSRIANRSLDLLELLVRRGLISKEEVAQRVNISIGNEEALRAVVRDRNGTIESLRDEIASMEAGREEIEETLDGMINEIQEALGEELEEEDDEITSRLRSALSTLLDEYLSLKAQVEEG